jgi:hypothetical protein
LRAGHGDDKIVGRRRPGFSGVRFDRAEQHELVADEVRCDRYPRVRQRNHQALGGGGLGAAEQHGRQNHEGDPPHHSPLT